MRLFALVFLALYGTLQGYVLWRVQRAFPGRWPVLLGTAAFLVAMMAAPIAAHALGRSAATWPARVYAVVGYVWMAVAMWFFLAGVAIDAWNVGALVVAHWRPAAAGLRVGPRAALAGLGVLVMVGIAWGSVEARWLRVRKIVLPTARLTPGSKPITIAEIADLHLSAIARPARLERALSAVATANPDMILFAGDIVDGSPALLTDMADRLRRIDAPLGKYGIFGNHEFYAGVRESEDFYRRAGIELLRGRAVTIDGGRLLLVGLDDEAGAQFGHAARDAEDTLLPPPGKGRPLTVLLKHRPNVARGSAGRFDLQLSGHVHGGQIFPFMAVVRCFSRCLAGLHQVEGGWLFVSRGAGTWGPPLRVFAPPDVAIITFVPAGD